MRPLIDKEIAVDKAKEAAGKPFGAALIVKQLEAMPEVKRSFRLADAVNYDRLIKTGLADSVELKMPIPQKNEEEEIIPLPLKFSTEIGDLGYTAKRITALIVEHQERIIMQAIRFIGGTEFTEITIDKNKVVEALQKTTAVTPKQYGMCGNPLCSAELVKGQKYCSVCGQKVDWGMC